MLPKMGAFSLALVFIVLSLSAQPPRSELNQQAVRLMAKEVATRLFDELGKKPDNGLARKIRDSLKVCRQDCDAEKIIVRVAGPKQWKLVQGKIAELNALQRDQALVMQDDKDFEEALHARLTEWFNKYATGDAAYGAIAQDQPAIRQVVSDWLQTNHPTENTGSHTDTTGSMNGDGSEDFDDPPPPKVPKTNLWEMILLFLLGFGVATGLWYVRWYKSSIKALQQWKAVSDFVYELGIANVSLSRPMLIDSELTSLIKTLNNRSTENPDKHISAEPPSSAKPERYDHQEAKRILDRIREIVGSGTSNANLPDVVKRLKEQNNSKPNEQPEPPRKPVSEHLPKLVEEQKSIPQAQAVIAYFAEPNADGFFNSDQRADQPSPDTCYRFALPTADATTADFRFEGVPSGMKRFLNLRYHFLDSACESENNYQPAHSRVVTLQEGKARLTNDQWRVETKAQIRFE